LLSESAINKGGRGNKNPRSDNGGFGETLLLQARTIIREFGIDSDADSPEITLAHSSFMTTPFGSADL
jgi:hypothetical protein